MKKNLYLSIIGTIFSLALSAQSICDSIAIDSCTFDGAYYYVNFSNQSQYSFANPLVQFDVAPNPYITSAPGANGGALTFNANGGTTQALGYVLSSALETNVPLNTVFSATVTLTNPADSTFMCSFTTQFTFGTMPVGINEQTKENADAFMFCPNPCKASSSIILKPTEASLQKPAHTDLKIYDAAGRLAFARQIAVNEFNGAAGISIQLPEVLPGIYFAEINAGEKIFRKKLVVQ